uniref:ATP synthase complex subunit 8 n=1 Tax=Cryptocephalus pusillus TaxID=877924 RepID=A0A1P8NM03_9CUCU|nr:ATP synthase F0 subunit 8 [Cryptocephalus pusillus]
MPQMAPINWLTLFILFCIYILVFSSMNFFFFMKTPLKNNNNPRKIPFNWLW